MDARVLRIERLELENFKSYRGYHCIGPFRDFTAIIGPNGSGKSNVMDAICFVLGLISSHIRGADLKDLIYRGDGSVGATYVKLTISSPSTSSELLRSILPSGQSEYRFDGLAISAADYKAKLESMNVFTDIKNCLIFQGDVEAVANRSAKDLTSHIEKISGSDQLQGEYDRLLGESTTAKSSLAFARNKIRAVQAEKKQFKEQKTEADKFLELKERLSGFGLTQILVQLFYLRQELQHTKNDQQRKLREVAKLTKQNEETESLVDDKKRALAELTLQVQTKQKQLRHLEQELEQHRPHSISSKQHIIYLSKRLEENKSKSDQIRDDIVTRDALIASLEADLKHLDKEEERLLDDLSQKQARFASLTAAQLAELTHLRERAAATSATEREELTKLQRIHQVDLDSLGQKQLRKAELEARQQELISETALIRSRRIAADASIAEFTTRLAQTSSDLDVIRKTNSDSKSQYETLSQQLSDVQDQLREAKAVSKQTDRERKLQECVVTLQQLFGNAVHGRLLDLVQPLSADFARAVAVVLGPHSDSIVVEDERVAQDCLVYLRDQRLGVATFLPMSTIDGKPVDDSLRTLHARVRPIVDVIQYDRRYTRVVEHVCGKTLLCEDLDTARKLAFQSRTRYRTVTMDGTLISKSGFMTGGSSEQGLERARQRWTDKSVAALKTRRDTLLTSLSSIGSSIIGFTREQQLRSSVEALKDSLCRLQTETDLLDTRLHAFDQQLAATQAHLTTIMLETAQLEDACAMRASQIASISVQVDSMTRSIFSQFEQKYGINDARDFEERQDTVMRQFYAQRLQIQSQRSRLKGLLSFERSRSLELDLKLVQEQIRQDTEAVELETNASATTERRLVEILRDLKQASAELKVLQNDSVSALELETKALKKSLEARHKLIGALSKQIAAHEAAQDSIRERRHNLYKRAIVEQIHLPLTPLSAPLPSPDDFEAAATEAASSSERLAQQDDISVDFDGLPEKWKTAASPAQKEELLRRVASDIQACHAEMNRLSPNLKATDKLDDVRSRLDAAKQELRTSEDHERSLRLQFAQIREQRTSTFLDAFNQIRGVVDEIYKRMTGGAGMADLSLESLEDPFLHGVKFNAVPPSKTFRDIAELSGGEKTVASLALLFAIHSCKPAPFFIMDEVDAALDAKNVETVAKYLRERSSEIQLILISLKPQCYERADALIGVCVDVDSDSSKCLSLDLSTFES